MSISKPKKASAPSDATKRWQARVDAARKAVTELQQALRLATTSAEQNFLFRELKEKEQALQAALRAKW